MLTHIALSRHLAIWLAMTISSLVSAQTYISAEQSDRLLLAKKAPQCCQTYDDHPTKQLLSEAFNDDVVLRVMFWAAFKPEAAIGMRYRGGNFELFRASPKYPMWWYSRPDMIPELQSEYSGLPDEIFKLPVSHCVAPVDKITGQGLIALWRRMLSDVIDAKFAPGTDGESYSFAMRDMPVTGDAISPNGETRLTRLVAVVDRMGDYCRASTPRAFYQLSDAIAAVK